MNKKDIMELLTESLAKSYLLPIREILNVSKTPSAIWEDSFLSAFLGAHLGEYMHLLEIETGIKLEPDDITNVITNADPDNANLILGYFSGEIEPDFDENESKRAEEIAKRVIFLSFKSSSFTIRHYDENDDYINFAYKKAETMRDILTSAYPGSPIINEMNNDTAAAQALIHYKVFDYVRENKNKFINTNSVIDDDKLTLREIYKYGKKNLSKDLKKGIDKVLDADLKKINKKNIEGFFSQGGDNTLIKFTLIICVLLFFLGIMHGI